MASERFQSLKEFWPHYLREHSNPTSRRLHFLGTSGFFAAATASLAMNPVGFGAALVGMTATDCRLAGALSGRRRVRLWVRLDRPLQVRAQPSGNLRVPGHVAHQRLTGRMYICAICMCGGCDSAEAPAPRLCTIKPSNKSMVGWMALT